MTQTVTQRRFSKLAAAINQKATKLGTRGRVTAEDLAIVYMEGKGLCAYCGIEVSTAGVSFDHVKPFVKGGLNVLSNLAPSCLTCQRGKFTKSPTEWAVARGLVVTCEVCQRQFKPRWADHQRGYGKMCSRKCSGTKGGQGERLAG